MGPLTALVIATPILGFSLTPPSMDVGTVLGPAAPGLAVPALVAAAPAPAAGVPDGAEAEGASAENFGTMMKRRAEITKLHKPFGIATWASMTLTVALGVIQYYNLYGFGAGQNDNPCVTGDAVFGQGQCRGVPWLHLSSALLTTALYGTTFGLSFMMPDPGGLDEGEGEYAKDLRTHKLLRWIHFGGMIAQIALGIVVANGERFGLDRANDYGTLKALSTVHLGIGLVTYGALTWAGTIML